MNLNDYELHLKIRCKVNPSRWIVDALQKMNTMTEYPESLYNEVVKDYEYRFPKFDPIPYPRVKQLLPKPIRPTNNNSNK